MKKCQEWRCRDMRRKIAVQIRLTRKWMRQGRAKESKYMRDFDALYYTAQINVLQLLVGRHKMLCHRPAWMEYDALIYHYEKEKENDQETVANPVA